jgi:multicomponent Na+:H+ antiporter subunit E
MSRRRTIATALGLAVLWMLLLGRFTPPYALGGLVVGYAAARLSRPLAGADEIEPLPVPRPGDRRPGLLARAAALLRLGGLYAYDLALTNLTMARDVLRATPRLEPGIFGVVVPGLGPAGVTLLANLVALTPGSLVIDFDERTRTLYVHTIYLHHAAAMERDILRFARLIRIVAGHDPDAVAA